MLKPLNILMMFSDVPVYPSTGNHESFPVNMFPTEREVGKYNPGWLYTGMAQAFQHWLPDEAQQSTMREGGYYQVHIWS